MKFDDIKNLPDVELYLKANSKYLWKSEQFADSPEPSWDNLLANRTAKQRAQMIQAVAIHIYKQNRQEVKDLKKPCWFLLGVFLAVIGLLIYIRFGDYDAELYFISVLLVLILVVLKFVGRANRDEVLSQIELLDKKVTRKELALEIGCHLPTFQARIAQSEIQPEQISQKEALSEV